MKPTRIMLSEAASRHLDATGEACFVVASFDRSDERSGRWVLWMIPTSYAKANSAVRVAVGESTERRKKTDTLSDLPPAPRQAADTSP